MPIIAKIEVGRDRFINVAAARPPTRHVHNFPEISFFQVRGRERAIHVYMCVFMYVSIEVTAETHGQM